MSICFSPLNQQIKGSNDASESAPGNSKKATQKAEAATLAKSNFLAMMSHEIRTPLFGIIAQTELLKLLNECISTVARSAEKKGLSVTFAQSDQLNLCLTGDSHRLKQILLNLLSNAVKFTPNGGVITLIVEILKVKDDNAQLQFKVTDTGIGMDEATRKNIFERFTQADSSTTRQYGGTGLGLSISSQLVSMMGGQLTAESQPGKGSSFQFSLTLQVAPQKEPVPKNKKQAYPQLGLSILIAEDNDVNQLIISRQLDALGCSYQLVADGAAALEILKSDSDIQLVLMDDNMPVLDGKSTSKIIREWGNEDGAGPVQSKASKLPIVLFTANVIDKFSLKNDYPHMTDFLVKPISIQQLSDVLKKYLGNLDRRD